MEDGDNPHPYIGHHRGQANDKPMEDGDKPHPYTGGTPLALLQAALARFLSLAKPQRMQRSRRSLGEEVQANVIRLQGAALVAVRKVPP